MAKSENQKLKLLYLMKILLEKTDEEHILSVAEIICALAQYGICAERKSIYSDIEALRIYGIDIECVRRGSTGYYVANRTFELPELKLLVDSVQSSKFITHKKSAELIKKLETFASHYDAQLLQRQVYVANRIKTMNESIYYNVDKIHSGIGNNLKISFKYYEYTVAKERKWKRNGERYIISPLALSWDNENYYLIGFDAVAGIIKHYRVDKMVDINITNEARDGLDEFARFDLAVYARKVFSMFGGTEELVRLRFVNELIGVIIDRFGKEVSVMKDDDSHFVIAVNVAISPQFFGWLSSFGTNAKILSPQSVAEDFRRHISAILNS